MTFHCMYLLISQTIQDALGPLRAFLFNTASHLTQRIKYVLIGSCAKDHLSHPEVLHGHTWQCMVAFRSAPETSMTSVILISKRGMDCTQGKIFNPCTISLTRVNIILSN